MKNVLKKTTKISHITELTILSLCLNPFYATGFFLYAEKTSLLAGEKTANFAGFIFTIRSCIMNFVEFIFTIVRFKSRK